MNKLKNYFSSKRFAKDDLYGNTRQSVENAFTDDSHSDISQNYYATKIPQNETYTELEQDLIPEESQENLKQQLKELLDENDYKGVRKLLRRNDNCNNLKSRELNEDLNVGSHRFVMRNGRMTFIPIKVQNCSAPKEHAHESLQGNSQALLEPCQSESKVNGLPIESILQEIIDVVNRHSNVLAQIFTYLNNKDPSFIIR